MTDELQEYVYAIGHPHGYVKIGWSEQPQKRLNQHQTSSPYELWIIVQIPVQNSQEVESKLHERFSEKSVRGEWFELDYSDYDTLADHVKMAASEREFATVEEFRQYQQRKEVAVLR